MRYLKEYSAILLSLLLLSCQNEAEEQRYDLQGTFTDLSPLTAYLQRVAMVKTVQDNVIDGSNYCTIKIPYSVTVNNEKITINSPADYQKVRDNINAASNDADIVAIDFPVTMVYYNYIQKNIPNQDDFNSLTAYWNLHPDLLSKINGLTINYPITVNIYNKIYQTTGFATIVNDEAFFNFIKGLDTGNYISLKYPISIVDYHSQTRSITNNLEFENAIKYAIDYCPENNLALLDFTAILTSSSWKIPYYFYDSDKTSVYAGYSFVFKSDKSVIASKGATTEEGHWESIIENGTRQVKIMFNSELLGKLNSNWKVFEFNNSKIRLRETGNNPNYLFLEKQ